jgi:processive 1,2-diacylglycerol beta-glucosyltransferase
MRGSERGWEARLLIKGATLRRRSRGRSAAPDRAAARPPSPAGSGPVADAAGDASPSPRAGRVLILTAGSGSGHNVAAEALRAAFEGAPGVASVRVLDALELTSDLYRELYARAYFGLVETVPWIVGWGYDYLDPPFRTGALGLLWDRLNASEVTAAIRNERPDTVVCTHFLPARLTSLLLARGELRARFSVVLTDYDFQGLWLSSPFGRFFVARDETRQYMADIGLPADRITVSGIPVRQAFSQPLERADVLARHGLRPDGPILLLSAGAAGAAYTRQVVEQTLQMQHAFQAVVVCGRNQELRAEMEALVAPRADRYRVLGYTTDMPALMRVAALFVGKPGGLSAAECTAAGLPAVLVRPIPGQEERNSDYLLEEGAAVRCNYPTTVGYKIDRLLGDPARLRRMAANAHRLGRPDAAARVAETALGDEPAPLWITRAARRAILTAVDEGSPARGDDPDRRVGTLVDVATGTSVAVVTAAQLSSVAPRLASGPTSDGALSLTPRALGALRVRGVERDLIRTLGRALGQREEMSVAAND